MSDLTTLLREPRVVELPEVGAVPVRPLAARDWVRIAQPAAQVVAAVRSQFDGQAIESAQEAIARLDILFLLDAAGDALIEAMAIATRTEAETIAELTPDALLLLVDAVLEVNWSFFVGHLLPQARSLGSKWEVKAREATAGQRPSSV